MQPSLQKSKYWQNWLNDAKLTELLLPFQISQLIVSLLEQMRDDNVGGSVVRTPRILDSNQKLTGMGEHLGYSWLGTGLKSLVLVSSSTKTWARERAIYNFMLDEHGKKATNWTYPSYMVNHDSMFGTGQNSRKLLLELSVIPIMSLIPRSSDKLIIAMKFFLMGKIRHR